MNNQELLDKLKQELQQVTGKFLYQERKLYIDKKNYLIQKQIVHDTYKDSMGSPADVLVALFKYMAQETEDVKDHVSQVINGITDLHHISYMLGYPHKFFMEVEMAGRAQKEILTFGLKDDYKQYEKIKLRVKIRRELEKLVEN